MKISKKTIMELSNEFSKIENADEFLHRLGDSIRKELSDLRLIGEIERPEGKDTYVALKNALKKFCEIKKISEFDVKDFDCQEGRDILSLYFVWAGVFHYGAEGGHELWKHVFGELGLRYHPSKSTKCGKIFRQCLEENDLESFPKLSGRQYVSRILLHGLIPEKHIGKFIETFILEEVSSVRARYRTGQSLIHKWSKERRIETQPVPIKNFIRHGRPINGDVVDRFWEMIENWEEEDAEFWRRWRLPKYMVDAFKSSVDSSGQSKRMRPRKGFFGRPFLTFDFQRNDFPTLFIPSQPIASGSSLKIESKALQGRPKETVVESDALRIGNELILQSREIEVEPSREWSVVLPGKSQTLVHQFPEDDSGCEIPVFIFNNSTGKSFNFAHGKPFPKEIMTVFPRDASFKIERAETLTPEISLSHLWRDWNCATYRIGDECEIAYEGPNIGFSKEIEVLIRVAGEEAGHDLPFLDCVHETPSWVRTDGNISVITDVQTLVVRFSEAARKIWRRGIGKLVRLDAFAPSMRNSYFDLDLFEDGNGFVSQPDILKRLEPGVYEIRIRGALGMEDVVLLFVYFPVSKFERRGAEEDHGIHNRFLLHFTVPVAFEAYANNSVQWPGKNTAVVKLEQDGGEAFCALKLFGDSKFPVTLLLARGPIRWVRRSEEGLFHWYDWRSFAEEIPIDRLKELRDTRILVEIDAPYTKSVAKVHKISNRLRLLLKSMDDESPKNGESLMSLNAQNYKRGIRDIWVLDLKKLADQMTSMKEAGNAELVLEAPGSFPDTVLFRLLRYSEFKNFHVISDMIGDDKETLTINWLQHPNEVRKNRAVTLESTGEKQDCISLYLPDSEKPPIRLEIKPPKKPDIWTAKIEVRQSRFGGRFSNRPPNASCELLRIPKGWVDWLEIPDAPTDEFQTGFSSFLRFMDQGIAWRHIPWSSFLTLFHQGNGKNCFDELNRFVGGALLNRMFPFSNGSVLRIRSGNQTVSRLRILSDMEIDTKSGSDYDSLQPVKWCRLPATFSIRFSAIPKASENVCVLMRTDGNGEPVVKTSEKEYPFSRWLADEKGCNECGSIMPELPLDSIWKEPSYPKMMDSIDCQDCFSYESICMEENLSGAKSVGNSIKHLRTGRTAMAAAFEECLGNIKDRLGEHETVFPRIDKETRREFHSLTDRWKEYSQSESVHAIIRKMIQMRLNHDPVQALSGAVAMINRLTAHDFTKPVEGPGLENLLNDTRSFVAENLPKSFLRDLILSEILICWYWNKRCLEFKGITPVKPAIVSKFEKAAIIQKPVIVSGYKEKSGGSFLASTPRSLAVSDDNKMWREKGFLYPDIDLTSFERNELDFEDIGDDIILDIQTGLRRAQIVRNEIEFEDKGDGTILDIQTGLMWQQEGSFRTLSWEDSKKYVDGLNWQKFTGYKDWRIPKIEELGSLLVPPENWNRSVWTAHYMPTHFSKKQITCWSSNKLRRGEYWYISFFSGLTEKGRWVKNYIRAVRTAKQK